MQALLAETDEEQQQQQKRSAAKAKQKNGKQQKQKQQGRRLEPAHKQAEQIDSEQEQEQQQQQQQQARAQAAVVAGTGVPEMQQQQEEAQVELAETLLAHKLWSEAGQPSSGPWAEAQPDSPPAAQQPDAQPTTPTAKDPAPRGLQERLRECLRPFGAEAAPAMPVVREPLPTAAGTAGVDASQAVAAAQRLAPPAAPGALGGYWPAPSEQQHAGLPGLRNESGEYNCFLNAVVQCLHHCPPFRRGVRRLPAASRC